MKLNISKIFKGDRKYFTIVFFVLIALFVAGLITPVIVENKNSKWEENLKAQIVRIEKEAIFYFRNKETELVKNKNKIKEKLSSTLYGEAYNYGELISLINTETHEDYSLEVVAPNGKIIAWNKNIAIKQEDIFPFVYPIDEAHFYSKGLFTYLTTIDTVKIINDIFYLIVSKPIEKHYSLQNQFYSDLSLKEKLSNKFSTRFEIIYNPFSQPSKDGRIYSFSLLNSKQNKIGIVSFFKPLLNTETAGIKDFSNKIQILLLLAALLFISLGLRKEFLSINSLLLRLFAFIIYLAILRLVLFWTGFPSRFLEGALVDPSFFSSTFAWGLVKTPIEAFITNLFLIVIGVTLYRYVLKYFFELSQNRFRLLKLIIAPFLALILFYTLRGLSASIKSIIFDSTIRYFKEPDLIPNFPSLLMNLNILLIGLSCIVLMVALTLLVGKFLALLNSNTKFSHFLLYFILIQIACFVFFNFQNEPLITPFMCFIFISLIFLLIFFQLYKKSTFSVSVMYSSLVAAVITISMLNYFNLELEQRSLKTIANEVNRSNKDLLNFLVDETLRNSINNKRLVGSFYKLNSNYDAEAFITWSSSALQRESLNSKVILLDRNFKTIGEFSVGYDYQLDFRVIFKDKISSEQTVELFEQKTAVGSGFVGIVPVAKNNVVTGYIGVAAEFNIENLGAARFPDFLESNKVALGSVIDLNLVKVFEFSNGRVSRVHGNLFPSKEQKDQIFTAPLTNLNDGWISLSIYGEGYLTYLLKTSDNNAAKYTVVSIKEKEIAWSLFNFFKIFIIHSLYILLATFALILFRLIKIQYTFKTKLLVAFLVISIIPLVALAVYNREVVRERSAEATFNELSKRLDYLENHVRAQIYKHPERNLLVAFDNAGKELGIAFSVYENSNQIYSSKAEFYNSGLMEQKLNPDAHFNLNYLSYRDFLLKEKINKYDYDAYYRKIDFEGTALIVGVNDALNNIELSYSPLEADIFLFGIYAFALIVIIFVSTFFANQISSPIRRLTKATEAVAQGDLSVNIENKERGEIKDLFDGFNQMTAELQKNQVEIAELERENAWKEMAKQVAHEIKNPLTPMKLSMQQLIATFNDKKENFGDTLKKLSQAVLNQIENLNLIASEFSSLAKMPSLNIEKFNLNPIVADTVNLFSDEKVEIKLIAPKESVYIEADKSQIRRMIINLIRNSIQANASLVIIEIEKQNVNAVLNFEDNGTGIPEKFQKKIFDANFTTKEKGLGLGLKLIKRFLENINGEIFLVESTKSNTTFRIVIPIND
ncbi:MAG: HAMP domain-containing protein [Ignavibacteria bacterium]|nr:HAMP domain-containing protein [Ignavibacteria bacterium]